MSSDEILPAATLRREMAFLYQGCSLTAAANDARKAKYTASRRDNLRTSRNRGLTDRTLNAGGRN